jgi:hypothetical protein
VELTNRKTMTTLQWMDEARETLKAVAGLNHRLRSQLKGWGPPEDPDVLQAELGRMTLKIAALLNAGVIVLQAAPQPDPPKRTLWERLMYGDFKNRRS